MVSSRALQLLSAICLLNIAQAIASSVLLHHLCVDKGDTYSSDVNSTYKANLNTLLSSLSNAENAYNFYNSSYGDNPDKVYAISLCRGDVKPDVCRSCLNDSTVLLTRLCPHKKEAISWYDDCMLRYSNHDIFGAMESGPVFHLKGENVSADAGRFNQDLKTLLDSLRGRAAAGGSLRKFAVGNTAVAGNFQTIYSLVQCTPDLSEQDCSTCLRGAIGNIAYCCEGRLGGIVYGPSCNLRFDVYRFYDSSADEPPPLPPTAQPASPPPSTNTKGKKSNKSRTSIIIVLVLVVLIISICIYLRLRKPREKLENKAVDEDEIRGAESLQFDFDTIIAATENFSDANKLGQGEFGVVYKGILSNGEVIAVKRLSRDSRQGDLKFKNEVLLITKLQHRNLVRLLGFCLEGNERLLIYEYVTNTSLDHFIFDPIKRVLLDWERRYKIIKGIAQGLLYLHEDSQLRIIHRDLRANNILLDAEMNPKISNFGMTRLFTLDQTQGNASRIMGTYGYMAPEYAMHEKLSMKSDVFNFGVLILEMVTRQKKSRFQSGKNKEDHLTYVWKNWREGTTSNLVDPTLKTGPKIEIMRCFHIGLLCVQENEVDRPTMASVVRMLTSYSTTLPVPSPPAIFMNDSIESDTSFQWEHYFGLAEADSGQLSQNSASFKYWRTNV